MRCSCVTNCPVMSHAMLSVKKNLLLANILLNIKICLLINKQISIILFFFLVFLNANRQCRHFFVILIWYELLISEKVNILIQFMTHEKSFLHSCLDIWCPTHQTISTKPNKNTSRYRIIRIALRRRWNEHARKELGKIYWFTVIPLNFFAKAKHGK